MMRLKLALVASALAAIAGFAPPPAGAEEVTLSFWSRADRSGPLRTGNIVAAAKQLNAMLAAAGSDTTVKLDVHEGNAKGYDEDALQLLLRAYQRVDVLDGANLGVLHGRSFSHGQKRLAGRIGDEMQMESARKMAAGHLWKTPEFFRDAKSPVRPEPARQAVCQQVRPQPERRGQANRPQPDKKTAALVMVTL